MKYFNEACDIIVAKEDKQYAERLRGRAANYLAFLKYPQEVRIHIYTTNAVESIYSGLELMRHELGEYFTSRQSLDINHYAQIIGHMVKKANGHDPCKGVRTKAGDNAKV
ncbi:MAG: hypothetical protein JRM98_05520 [Nitrososphaerota archaeon]|jgi:transposase-like protein|nr:hypothetical protein [Nitrososphaerota archaeon]MDG7043557.1 hypothetical protein [Nitrososphaerota archaeon]